MATDFIGLWLPKIILVPLCNNIDKLEVLLSGNDVEIVVLCNTLDSNHPIADTVKMIVGGIMF